MSKDDTEKLVSQIKAHLEDKFISEIDFKIMNCEKGFNNMIKHIEEVIRNIKNEIDPIEVIRKIQAKADLNETKIEFQNNNFRIHELEDFKIKSLTDISTLKVMINTEMS